MINRDEYFMRKALILAKLAAIEDEVPVGAIIVKDKNIISFGRNRRENKKNALYHAEIEAIDKACKVLGGWRLCGCEMYVTLEPCPMCTGAIINSRIKRVVFGTVDPKSGSAGSKINLFELGYNHKPELVSGILKDQCSKILIDFFKTKRKKVHHFHAK